MIVDPQPLLDCEALGALMGVTARTVQANASRAPERLPPRAPGHLLRWHPDAYKQWAIDGGAKRKKPGRPRQST